VELKATAMGTSVEFVAFTNPDVDEVAAKAAFQAALDEIARLERLMTSWRDDSEIGAINRAAGKPVSVSLETFTVIEKSQWIGKLSSGTFDITFETMSGLWKFGDAQDAEPKLPSATEVEAKRRLVDYRKVSLDRATRSVSIGDKQKISLGGIAKGYIVDRGADVLRKAKLSSFLVQAGGDLFGAGKKPDGSPWVSGIQDPRGPEDNYFATIELQDHAFSTAGDYARAYKIGGKRYHHIIDPRTGYPATASRSVTVWAPDAFLADAVDDAVFILGPEKGLELVESLEGVGAVIVDQHNKVWLSIRVRDQVTVAREPTDGP
jgi:FAD:protein FMN transferase